MTTPKNLSGVETLINAVSTASSALQQLMVELKAMKITASTDSSKSEDSLTSSPPSTEPKKRRGRPPKTEAMKKASEAQDLGTTTTTAKSEPQPLQMLNSGQPSVESSTTILVKRRGASAETLAKARAAMAAKRAQVKGGMGAVEVKVEEPIKIWPFPSSTRYNSDGTEKTC